MSSGQPALKKLKRVLTSFELPKGNTFDYLEIIEELGSGSFGDVYKCLDKRNNNFFALKHVYNRNKDFDMISNEFKSFQTLKEITCDSIIKIYEVERIEEKEEEFVIMQYCSFGDLLRFLEKHFTKSQELPNWLIYKIVFQCIMGLKSLYKHNVIHRDLKLDNILIEDFDLEKQIIKIRIGDFGLAYNLNEDIENSEMEGNIEEMRKSVLASAHQFSDLVGYHSFWAPEVEKDYIYSHESDMWALGIILFQLLTYHWTKEQKEMIKDVYTINGEFWHRLKIKENHRKPLWDLVIKVLQTRKYRYNSLNLLLEALANFREISEEFIDETLDYLHLAMKYIPNIYDKYDEALEWLDKFREMEQDIELKAISLYYTFYIYFIKGLGFENKHYLENAINLFPNYSAAYINLSELYFNIDTIKSLQYTYKALECNPASIDAVQRLFFEFKRKGVDIDFRTNLDEIINTTNISKYDAALIASELEENELTKYYILKGISESQSEEEVIYCMNKFKNYYFVATRDYLEFYFKVLEKFPKQTEALFNVGLNYFRQKNYEKALYYFKSCQEAANESNNNPPYSEEVRKYVYGICYYELNDKLQAYNYWSKILDSEETGVLNYLNDKEDYDMIISLFDINSFKEMGALNTLVNYYVEKKDFAHGEKIFKYLIEQFPNWSDAYYGLGRIKLMLSEIDIAIQYFEKALDLNFQDETINLPSLLGKCYLFEKDFKKFIELNNKYKMLNEEQLLLLSLRCKQALINVFH